MFSGRLRVLTVSIRSYVKVSTGQSPQLQCSLYMQIPLLAKIFLCLDYNATKIIECPPRNRCQYDEVMILYSVWFLNKGKKKLMKGDGIGKRVGMFGKF